MRERVAACCLVFPLLGAQPPGPVGDLRNQARDVLHRVENQELALSDARVEVERLRRALIELGERHGWTPTRRALEISIRRPDRILNINFDDCPLFYEEELVDLCPLDLGQSEIWGNQVIRCEFLCAPSERSRP